MDQRWWRTFCILSIASMLFAVAIAIEIVFDPGDDDLEPAESIGTLLTLLGMALVVLSSIPVRHLRWQLGPYLMAASVFWFVAAIPPVIIVSLFV
jgi:hypothetical protein